MLLLHKGEEIESTLTAAGWCTDISSSDEQVRSDGNLPRKLPPFTTPTLTHKALTPRHSIPRLVTTIPG